MAESYELGAQFREFLRGLLGEREGRHLHEIVWGPRVNVTGLKDIYAPHRVEPFAVPPGGIDNLGLHSTDNFTIPGRGDFTVEFKCYFRVARDNPTTTDWANSELLVNIIDLRLYGQHKEIGEISVKLNPDIVSTGQIFQAPAAGQPKACRIATAAVFNLQELGVSVFNKEPILLMNESVKSIPPVDDPSGQARIFRLPLFNRADPNGKPLGYLTSLRYGADNYLSEAEVNAFRART